ncbi:SpvB/TcaC N-terminal domain-containing protein [Gemmatimonas sp.]|uniref:SpvB/TcaC N-terminal domain-containing protein n=1 Tax=Gemmatimonas sp. TaxID=1962908 RepID=UPI0039830B8C
MARWFAWLLIVITLLAVGCGGDSRTGTYRGVWSSFDACEPSSESVAKITPVLTCVAVSGDARIAIFGYQNDASSAIVVPESAQNRLVPAPDPTSADGRTRPISVFAPGFFPAAFTIRQSLLAPPTIWELGGRMTSDAAPACALSTAGGAVYVTLQQPGGVPPLVVQIAPSETNLLDGVVVPTEAPMGGQTNQPLTGNRLSGDFRVTPDGAATYRVDLNVPVGRAGMQPELGFDYSSRAGNGILGVGWILRGISQISRCTIRPENGDAPPPTQFQFTDTLCLDGDPLIIAQAEPGPNNVPTVTNTFHPQHDPFTRVLRTSAGFTVQRRDGRQQYYGGAGAQLTTALTSVDPSGYPEYGDGLTKTAAWFIRETVDRSGNAVRYEYEDGGYADRNCAITNKPCSAAELRPRSITYTHAADLPATRRVDFEYEDRTDWSFNWIQRFPLQVSKRLREVRISGPMPVAIGPVRSYRLTYDYGPVSRRSRLTRVHECDGAGVCKQPLELSYEDGDQYYDVAATDFVPTPSQTRDMYASDLDGDGMDDVLYRVGNMRTVAEGGFGKRTLTTIADWEYRRGTITKGVPRLAPPIRFAVVEHTRFEDLELPPISDFRAPVLFKDGVPYFPDEQGATRWVPYSFSATSVAPSGAPFTASGSAAALDIFGQGHDTAFEGDGATAMLAMQTLQNKAWSILVAAPSDENFKIVHPTTSTCAPFGLCSPASLASTVTPLRRAGVTHTLFDFNGDGISDSFDALPGSPIPPALYAGVGGGAFRRVQLPLIPITDWMWPSAPGASGTMVLDQDQTGLGKILVYAGDSATPTSAARILSVVPTPSGFVAEWRSGPQTAPGVAAIDAIVGRDLANAGRVLDVNGDGLEDILLPGKLLVRRGQKADLLKSAVGAIAARIAYTPLRSPRIACAAPIRCGTRGLWSVANYDLTVAVGAGKTSVALAYEDPASNSLTGEFLGFRRTTETTLATGQTVVTTYDRYHEDGFSGHPTRIERRVSADKKSVLESVRTFEYVVRSYVPGTQLVLASRATDLATDNGAKVQTNELATTYDAFGNPFVAKRTAIVGALSATTTDTTTYFHRNDESRWLLGQVEAILNTSEVSDAASIAPQPAFARRFTRFEVDEATGLPRAIAANEGAGESFELRTDLVFSGGLIEIHFAAGY